MTNKIIEFIEHLAFVSILAILFLGFFLWDVIEPTLHFGGKNVNKES